MKGLILSLATVALIAGCAGPPTTAASASPRGMAAVYCENQMKSKDGIPVDCRDDWR